MVAVGVPIADEDESRIGRQCVSRQRLFDEEPQRRELVEVSVFSDVARVR